MIEEHVWTDQARLDVTDLRHGGQQEEDGQEEDRGSLHAGGGSADCLLTALGGGERLVRLTTVGLQLQALYLRCDNYYWELRAEPRAEVSSPAGQSTRYQRSQQ